MWEQIRRCNFQTGLSEQIGMEAFCGVNKKWAVKGKSWRADDVEFNLEASQARFYFSEFISAWNGIKAPPRWVLSSMYFTSDRRPPGPCRHGTTQHKCSGRLWSHRVRFHPRKGYRHVNGDPIKTYAAKLSSQKLTLLSHFITCKCGMKWNKWWNSSLNAGNAQVNCGVSTPCCLLAQLSWQSCLPQVSAIPILVLKTTWELELWRPACDEVLWKGIFISWIESDRFTPDNRSEVVYKHASSSH